MKLKPMRCHSVAICQLGMFTRKSTVKVFCIWISMMSLTDCLWAADGKPIDSVSSLETLGSPSMTHPSTHGPAALDGKRLFFAVEERRSNAISPAPVVAATLNVLDESEPLAVPEINPGAATGRAGPARSQAVSIQYTAWLKSGLSIRVIINGVPCQAVERRVLEDSRHGLGLTCRSLEAVRVNLKIEKDGQTLTLSRGTTRLGNLHPGDTW